MQREVVNVKRRCENSITENDSNGNIDDNN